MTLFPRWAEISDKAPESQHAEVADVIALIEAWSDWVVIDWLSAPNVFELPVGHSVTAIGDSRNAESFYLWGDSLWAEQDTMYMW